MSNRTLRTVAATVGSSRLPLRRKRRNSVALSPLPLSAHAAPRLRRNRRGRTSRTRDGGETLNIPEAAPLHRHAGYVRVCASVRNVGADQPRTRQHLRRRLESRPGDRPYRMALFSKVSTARHESANTLRKADTALFVAPIGTGRPANLTSTLKRTPSAAGLQQGISARPGSSSPPRLIWASFYTESETSSLKRQLARALGQVEEYKHAAERTTLEANIAAEKAQAQLDEAAARIDKLERHRTVLLAKEREAAERAEKARQDEDDGKAKLEQQNRELRTHLDQLQEEHSDLEASYADLEHAAKQAVTRANDQQQQNTSLRQEVGELQAEVSSYRQELTREKQRVIALEAALEQEKLRSHSMADSSIIREELSRESGCSLSSYHTWRRALTLSIKQVKSRLSARWKRTTPSCSVVSRRTSNSMQTQSCSKRRTELSRRSSRRQKR